MSMPTKTSYLFTSESVAKGHPDKVADQISDAIVDAILTQDPHARIACEVLVKTGLVFVAGEISTQAWVDIEQIARRTILEIGYNHADLGFDGESCAVLTAIGKQSVDIARGVDKSKKQEQGAGDQGLMFGFATDETDVLMPAPILYAHRLMQQQARMREGGILPWLGPDAKCQVTIRYAANQPVAVHTIVLSTQHDASIDYATLKEAVIEQIIHPVFPKEWMRPDTRFLINPTGRFVIGGPLGDTGLTGRKIIVDTYGGMARHGGGCFSGKDPSKVDRSGAYFARYIAKNIVAAGIAKRCEVQLAYAIGVHEPIAIYVDTFGTGCIPDTEIVRLIDQHFQVQPYGMIESLDLLRPIYAKTAVYGHFGRSDIALTWERTDKAACLR